VSSTVDCPFHCLWSSYFLLEWFSVETGHFVYYKTLDFI
jgi:hypothetical protein